MSRLSTTVTGLAASGKKALVAYIVAGDPEPAITVPQIEAKCPAGSLSGIASAMQRHSISYRRMRVSK